MPSPVGHALGGIAAGWLTDRPGEGRTVAGLYILAGIAADFDLLVGGHRGPSHGLGAALIAGALAWIAASRTRPTPIALRFGAAVAAAYGSHILLDWLGSDSRPPIGVMALWPISHEYFESPFHIFPAISRRYWLAEFWFYNLYALALELLTLGPVVAAVYVGRRRRTRKATER